MRKGVIELCVLRLLNDGAAYGYEINRCLSESGALTLKESTMYLILARLERDGLVSVQMKASERGPKRRYFSLNADGRARLAGMDAFWRELSSDVNRILDTGRGNNS